ncbi:MAG: hypothetical protein R2932_59245 [Caldilineaceae bacterium]
MTFGRVDTNGLVGINTNELDAELYEFIVKFEGTIKPVVVIREEFDLDRGDHNYRVIANHDVAYAATQARRIKPRECEMIEVMIVDADQEDEVKKLFK